MQADIFVNASTLEGMSNAVLEGMAAGLPSVVVDAPGVTECHVDGITGFVVRHNAQELATGIAKLLGDPGLSQRMGDAALLHVHTQYSMEACRKRYLALFGRLTGRDVCVES
jgi:glycosyltransferase involved in cell wall biosynthesis